MAIEADREALLRFFEDTCQAYALWLTAEAQRLAMRDAYLAELAFPAPAFRPGQRALARQVWRALSAGGALFAEAPTGIGKTLGVLYAALRRLPGLDCERALYLTPRGSARQLAIDAVAKMDPEGRTLRVVELIARERMCPTPGTPCRRDACERARGHFDRRRAALSVSGCSSAYRLLSMTSVARGAAASKSFFRKCTCASKAFAASLVA